jgi:hypothetical protein
VSVGIVPGFPAPPSLPEVTGSPVLHRERPLVRVSRPLAQRIRPKPVRGARPGKPKRQTAGASSRTPHPPSREASNLFEEAQQIWMGTP